MLSTMSGALRSKAAKAEGPVVVSDIVYCKVSISLDSREATDEVISTLSLSRCGYDHDVLFRAGKAFLDYRKNNGTKEGVLPDFLIGALAEVEGRPVLTRDSGKIRTYFPAVELITPESE